MYWVKRRISTHLFGFAIFLGFVIFDVSAPQSRGAHPESDYAITAGPRYHR